MGISGVGTSAGMIFGTRATSSKTDSLAFVLYRDSATTFRHDYFGANKNISISDASAYDIVDCNANVVSLYGQTITNTSVTSGTCTYPLYLFALNSQGAVTVPGAFKLHFCQI